MKFTLTKTSLKNFAGDCAVLFALTDKDNRNKEVQKLIILNNFDAKVANIMILNYVSGFKVARVILVGLGKSATAKNYQKALNALTLTLQEAKIKNVILEKINIDDKDLSWTYLTTARVIQNATYKIKKIGIDSDSTKIIEQVNIKADIDSNNDKALLAGSAIASGMALARELGDMPSNICTPSYLAQASLQLAKKYKLDCEILEKKDMSALGMHSLLSVSKGSIEPPKLISLHYKNNSSAKTIILVGKGVTFDSGGISIKASSNMDEMKYDMCGAASVLGTIKAIAKIKLAVNLTVIIPTVENMPSHNASKPGDVVKSMSGQTIEILNTDAEGRLILCDALTYCDKFNPKVVIDIATLTGAVIVALGKHNSGLLANDQKLANEIISASKDSLDGVWQLPLEDEYDELLKSNFADMANIGGREAGTITAACFLARYTKKYRWAHLDIAGTAWLNGSEKCSTGRPVPLLTQYIINQAKYL